MRRKAEAAADASITVISELKTQLTTCQTQLATRDEELAKMRVQTVEDMRAREVSYEDEITRERRAHDDEMTRLRTESTEELRLVRLQAAEDLRKMEHEQTMQLTVLTGQEHSLRADLQRMEQLSQEKEEACAALRQELLARTTELSALGARTSLLEQEKHTLTTQISSLQGRIDKEEISSRTSKENYVSQIECLRNEMNSITRTSTEQTNALSDELTSLRQQLLDAQQSNDSLRSSFALETQIWKQKVDSTEELSSARVCDVESRLLQQQQAFEQQRTTDESEKQKLQEELATLLITSSTHKTELTKQLAQASEATQRCQQEVDRLQQHAAAQERQLTEQASKSVSSVVIHAITMCSYITMTVTMCMHFVLHTPA